SGHSTPIIHTPKGEESQILVPGSFFLMAYSAATGKKLWWVGGLSFEMKSIPVIKDNILYINGYASPLNQPDQQVTVPSFAEAVKNYDKNLDGKLSGVELPKESPFDWLQFCDLDGDNMFNAADWNYFEAALASLNGMLAIRLGGKGDMTEKNSVWQYRRSIPQLPSPLLYRDVLYMLSDGGTVTCFNPGNGEVISQGRVRGAGSHFYASPVAGDGKVYIISLRGIVTVLSPDGQCTILAQSELGEECYATPAIADGNIYLRTVKTLYCFGLK
ncbi:MAG: PQQ-like beta-propeller repeat protein, partial [Candidatus Aminicenantes bacterium]|nr:PQQ-like beta-propeller repeat protein [Candidatus Aminicenantes bacterium]